MSEAGLNITHCGTLQCDVQYTKIEGGDLFELYCCVRPQRDLGTFAEQVNSVYEQLLALLALQGLSPRDLITERLFCGDIGRQYRELAEIRSRFYQGSGMSGTELPATSFLEQSPCQSGRLFELQAYALQTHDGYGLEVCVIPGLRAPSSGKLVRTPGYTQLYLQNLVGTPEAELADFTDQCRSMFEQMAVHLHELGAPLSQLVRTWIYLKDMERDYDALNAVRNRTFKEWKIARLPASTGIQGGTYPPSWRCAADLYAVWGDARLEIEAMSADTLNEAPAYGSAFSRGLKVVRQDRTILYVSGTASIDTRGEVVHVDNIEGQVHRMLTNVESLLSAQGAGFVDAVTVVTYLKCPAYLQAFARVCAARGMPQDMPNSVVVADVCRPEWLCEIELTAVL